MKRKSYLTAHGRAVLAKVWKPLPWLVTVAIAAFALMGCQTLPYGNMECHREPDGKITCSGEVVGM